MQFAMCCIMAILPIGGQHLNCMHVFVMPLNPQICVTATSTVKSWNSDLQFDIHSIHLLYIRIFQMNGDLMTHSHIRVLLLQE